MCYIVASRKLEVLTVPRICIPRAMQERRRLTKDDENVVELTSVKVKPPATSTTATADLAAVALEAVAAAPIETSNAIAA